MLISLPPLLLIAREIYHKDSSIVPAWIVVAIGGFFQHAFYTTSDPSKRLIMLVPWFVYWVVCIFVLIRKQ
jgi:ABC-type uncharacterized transport system permease subunit